MSPRPALLLLAALAAGCTPGPLVVDAPTGQTPSEYPNHTAEGVIAAVAASVAPVLRVAADGDLEIDADGQRQEATFSLRARLADSAAVTVRGPLGIEGGRALVTADSVFVANRLERQLLLGPLAAADRFVPGASVDGRIVRAALGLLVPEADVAWSVTAQDGAYRLVGRLAGGSAREYTVDPSVWRVVRVREFGPDGRQAGLQEVEALDTVDGVVLPRRVRLEGAGTVVRLEHRRLVVNPAELRIRFSRPADYEVIRVD